MKNVLVYSGVGSRQTPDNILRAMGLVSGELAKRNWHLRSGGAKGADRVFERFALKNFTSYRPINPYELTSVIDFSDFPPTVDEIKFIKAHYKSYDYKSDYIKGLQIRNGRILRGLGPDYLHSKFVVCWTEGGKDIGGTGVTIRMAHTLNIPVFNLGAGDTQKMLDDIWDYMLEMEKIHG